MKTLLLSLLIVIFLMGCATAPIKNEEKVCDRMIYNPQTGKNEPFICLGETMAWEGAEYTLLAEAVHPADKSIIAFFDYTGDCEVDVAAIYYLSESVYYVGGQITKEIAYAAISKAEKTLGVKILKRVPCLKK